MLILLCPFLCPYYFVETVVCRCFTDADIPVASLFLQSRAQIALWGPNSIRYHSALFTSRLFCCSLADDESTQGHGQHRLSLLIRFSFHQCSPIGSPEGVSGMGRLLNQRLTIKGNAPWVLCTYVTMEHMIWFDQDLTDVASNANM